MSAEVAAPGRSWWPEHRWEVGYGVVGLLATVAGLVLVARTAPPGCSQLHPAIQLAGSDDRLARLLGGCPDPAGFVVSVGWDFLLLAGYGLLLTAVLRMTWERYYAPQLAAVKALVRWLPAIAAGLDAVENALVLALVAADPTGALHYAGGVLGGGAIATAAWLKWFTLAATAVALVLGLVALGNGRRPVRAGRGRPWPYRKSGLPPVQPEDGAGRRSAEQSIGIACSGGGIRAAAFTLGALKALERRDPDAPAIMPRVCAVAAVSGGGYVATAWMLVRATSEPAAKDTAAADVHSWLTGRIPGTRSQRHRYLLNSRAGIGRDVLLAVALIGTNLAGLASLIALLAWPVGRVLGSDLVRPDLRRTPAAAGMVAPAGIPPELGYPALSLAALGAVALLASLPLVGPSRAMVRAALVLFGLAALLAVVFVGLPALIDLLRGSPVGGVPPLAVSGSALVGAAVAVWRIVRRPLVERLVPVATKLGGVLLAAAAVLFAGAVMNDAAGGGGPFGSPWAPVGAAVFAAVFSVRLNTNALSLQRLFRARLTATFGLRRAADGSLVSPPTREQVRWTELADQPIELLLCCTRESSELGLGGFRANSFVVSPREVQVDGAAGPTGRYLDLLPRRMWRFHSVVAWSGVSGAAFASAMGRLDLGTTNALLAAGNIDLGTWLPNPAQARGDAAAASLPHIRLSYLVKEILGWYNPDDPYTFLTDGGHWDNLGLVELLRRRHRTIVCVDASADPPGSFAALRQAAALARLAIEDCDVRIDLGPLDDPALAADPVHTLHVRYTAPDGGGTCGTIVHAKAQAGAEIPVGLRRFAAGDRRFPMYPTGDQFLTDEQFAKLVELGEHVGGRARRALPDDRCAFCDPVVRAPAGQPVTV